MSKLKVKKKNNNVRWMIKVSFCRIKLTLSSKLMFCMAGYLDKGKGIKRISCFLFPFFVLIFGFFSLLSPPGQRRVVK
jgi:hypothetical protein